MKNKVVLSLGSNSHDKDDQMQKCISWLKTFLENVSVSSIYETAALNGVDANYLNAVFIGYTDDDYEEIKFITKKYEVSCGRTKESKIKSSIPIDIDVVVWNDDIIKPADFTQEYFQIGMLEI